ncbi:transposase [Verrucomicrobium sp. BvORR034]|uniref:transposase n=1 Tax=Verrucomicrobium sp. BvORR034 TaxID=1396418 RepID=UPI000678854F|nr:transposase [Verrucomicrobium sp. BvORR034]
MASPRFFADPMVPVAYYHCISRVVERRLAFGPEEKEQFVRLMRAYEGFCQMRVLSYCVMSNHFHIMVEVQKRPEGEVYSDAWLLKQVALIYSKPAVRAIKEALETFRKQGHDQSADDLKEKYLMRMWDVSQFMKELKQRFSLWFNKREKRKGTLWEERFTSVLLEGELATLSVMSAYIDLNPVRAGLMQDPKDYRWCSYAEAVAGGRKALSALDTITREHRAHEASLPVEQRRMPKPEKVLSEYRVWLFGQGEEVRDGDGADSQVVRKGIRREVVEQVRGQSGKLTLAETLRHRVTYFTAGVALGRRSFVDSFFDVHREQFDPRRKQGARPMRGGSFAGMFTFRAPRVGVV